MQKPVLFSIIYVASLIATNAFAASKANLLNEPRAIEATVINLNTETRLELAPPPSRDNLNIGYRSLQLGRPSLVTPGQKSSYDFSSRPGIMMGWDHRLTPNSKFEWASAVGYFHAEQYKSTVATALHVVPLELGLNYFFTRRNLSPYIGASALGILQIQRGISDVQSSEIAGLWRTQLGLRIHTPWDFNLFTQLAQQTSWAVRNEEWSGRSFDLGFSYTM